jgi:hypothetical protein
VPAEDILFEEVRGQVGGVAGGYGGRIINIEAARGDIKIRNCEFATTAVTAVAASTSVIAIYLEGNNNTETFRHGRLIENCVFRGRVVAASAENLQALDLVDISDVTVRGCMFDRTTNGVMWKAQVALAANLLVEGCTFLDVTVDAYRVDTSSVVCTGFKFVNNHLEGSSGQDTDFDMFGSASSGIQDVIVAGNYFACEGWAIRDSNIRRINVQHNDFIAPTATSLAPRIQNSGSFSFSHINFSHNVVDGYESQSTVATLGIRIQSVVVNNLIISNNTFDHIMNGTAYGGAASSHSIVAVQCDTVNGAIISDNVFGSSINTAVTGANARPATLIELNSQDRTTQGFDLEVVVANNSMNGISAEVYPMFISHHDCKLNILGNNFGYSHGTVTRSRGDIDIVVSSGETSLYINIVGNTFDIRNATGGTLSEHVIDIGATASTLRVLKITDNLFTTDTLGWAAATGMGSTITTNWLVFDSNQGVIRDNTTADNSLFHITLGAITNSEPTVPSLNAYWARSQNCQQAA